MFCLTCFVSNNLHVKQEIGIGTEVDGPGFSLYD